MTLAGEWARRHPPVPSGLERVRALVGRPEGQDDALVSDALVSEELISERRAEATRDD